MFGFSESQFSDFFLYVGIGTLMVITFFMMCEAAAKCRIGKQGVALLIAVMSFSMLGFVVKAVVQQVLEIN